MVAAGAEDAEKAAGVRGRDTGTQGLGALGQREHGLIREIESGKPEYLPIVAISCRR